jgi:hypothetical protein
MALEVSGQQHVPTALYPQERPGTHCTGGWVGSRASLDSGKSRPTGIRSPDRPARSQSLYRLSCLAHTTVSALFKMMKRQRITEKAFAWKVLRYKSEGRWLDPRWCHEFFIDINPSDRTMALGSTQPLTEMSRYGQKEKPEEQTTDKCTCILYLCRRFMYRY